MSDTIAVEVWLYGPISRYGNEIGEEMVQDRTVKRSHAELHLKLPGGSKLQHLLDYLKLPPEEKGITFINGNLAAMPGVDADREVELHDGDRVGISHRRSMWPFQYRFGASLDHKLRDEFRQREDRGIHHAYTKLDE